LVVANPEGPGPHNRRTANPRRVTEPPSATKSHIARLDYGYAFESSKFNTEGQGLPLVRIRDVVPGRSQVFFDGLYDPKYLVQDGDYLIGMDGQFNLGRWRGGTALLNQRVCRLAGLHPSLHRGYLIRYLRPVLEKLEQATPFVTVKHLSASVLRNVQVPLLPMPEQRRIAVILDHADALRAKRRQVLDLLDGLRQSLLSNQFATTEWTHQIREMANIQIGPFGSLLHQRDYVRDGVPVLNPSHIRQNGLYPERELTVSAEKAATLSIYRLRDGDVIMGRRGEMARAAVVTHEHAGFLCGTGSLILRPNGSDSVFLHAVVTSARMKAHLERSSLGATLPNLNAEIVNSSPVPMPSLGEQRAFSAIAAQQDATVGHMRAATVADESLFRSLQSRAFRGEL